MAGLSFNLFNISLEIQKVNHAYPLCDSPIPITIITLVYLIFVLKLGPMLMKHRASYNLKYVLLAYNALQVFYNGYVFYNFLRLILIANNYDLRCIEGLPLDHPLKNEELSLSSIFYYNKILDLMDTIFFVLRKSFRQITWLHIYHHVMMINSCYFIMHFYGSGGHSSMMGGMNTAVHTIMYAYYFLSALSPEVKHNFRFKKSITQLQIAQFILIFGHTLIAIFNPNCGYPRSLLNMQLLQAIIMLIMFSNFYIKTYIKPEDRLSCPFVMPPKVSPPTEFIIGKIVQRKQE